MTKYTQRLCFLDLETTGFDPQKDSIIELSFVVLDQNGQEESRFDQLIQPEKSPLNDFVSELTGISQHDLDTEAKPLDTFKDEITTKIGDAVIVGHNIDFDINFLEAYGVPVKQNGRIDTHELARIVLLQEESYALEILAQKYGFKHENAHRAMSDVEVNIEIYDFLVEQIETLSPEFLAQIRPIIEKNSWWKEGAVLLASTSTKSVPTKKNTPRETPTQTIDIKSFSAQHNLLRAGTTRKTAELQKNLAYAYPKSVIVTERLDRFSGESFVPTPEVILAPQRFSEYLNQTFEKSIDITFAIQVAWRQFLGYRGKNFFDLFLHQYDLWNQVCLLSVESELFSQIIQERMDERVLVITPSAFLRFIDLPVFTDRTLIIDEGELFGESLLHAPTKRFSLLKYLNHTDEKISAPAHFWVSNFCQEVIREKTGHEISPFPTKILLKDSDKFADFADSATQFLDSSDQPLLELLTNPQPKEVRWLTYYPQNGDLVFESWHPEDWRALKEKLSAFKTLLFHRHTPSESLAFFRVFLGISQAEEFEFEHLLPDFSWEVPTDLISNRSPEYNAYCAQKIDQIARAEINDSTNVVTSFSSLETLRNTYNKLSESLSDTDIQIFGERVKGGQGKMFQMMKNQKNILLLLQKISDKNLDQYDFQHLILHRIPFSAPHPLLEKIEAVMKQSNQNFWEVWTTPQVSAALARRTADFETLQTVTCLDGRENAKWAKAMIYGAWPHLRQREN
ncbi:hypothetical protein CSB37_00930 [bacterium DOLZORAL124_38_8]|nr:MAG: hypothetical protein CSB37_00930 [bacterium DOLZORAL124_38_8]